MAMRNLFLLLLLSSCTFSGVLQDSNKNNCVPVACYTAAYCKKHNIAYRIAYGYYDYPKRGNPRHAQTQAYMFNRWVWLDVDGQQRIVYKESLDCPFVVVSYRRLYLLKETQNNDRNNDESRDD